MDTPRRSTRLLKNNNTDLLDFSSPPTSAIKSSARKSKIAKSYKENIDGVVLDPPLFDEISSTPTMVAKSRANASASLSSRRSTKKHKTTTDNEQNAKVKKMSLEDEPASVTETAIPEVVNDTVEKIDVSTVSDDANDTSKLSRKTKRKMKSTTRALIEKIGGFEAMEIPSLKLNDVTMDPDTTKNDVDESLSLVNDSGNVSLAKRRNTKTPMNRRTRTVKQAAPEKETTDVSSLESSIKKDAEAATSADEVKSDSGNETTKMSSMEEETEESLLFSRRTTRTISNKNENTIVDAVPVPVDEKSNADTPPKPDEIQYESAVIADANISGNLSENKSNAMEEATTEEVLIPEIKNTDVDAEAAIPDENASSQNKRRTKNRRNRKNKNKRNTKMGSVEESEGKSSDDQSLESENVSTESDQTSGSDSKNEEVPEIVPEVETITVNDIPNTTTPEADIVESGEEKIMESTDNEIKDNEGAEEEVVVEIADVKESVVETKEKTSDNLFDESCILLSDSSDVMSDTFTKEGDDSIKPIMDLTFSPKPETEPLINDTTFSPEKDNSEDNVRIQKKISIVEIFDTPAKRTSTPKASRVIINDSTTPALKPIKNLVSLSFSSTATPPRIYNIVKPIVKKTPIPQTSFSKTLKRLVTPKANTVNLSNKKILSAAIKNISMTSTLKEPLKSCRKRSLSITDAENVKKHNRVTFHSPMNTTVEIDVLDNQMHRSVLGDVNSSHMSPQKPRNRSLSFSQNQSNQEFNGTPKKMVKPMKMPNFASIHEKHFQKMESIVDYTLRKTERSQKMLITPTSNTKKVLGPIMEPNVFNLSKIPVRMGIENKSITIKKPMKSKVVVRREKHMEEFKKMPTDAARETYKRRATIVKGVRTNRRFELQMQMRKGLPQ